MGRFRNYRSGVPPLASAGSDAALSHALRQATLKAAFSGKLIGQDATGKPASVLLERIAAERSQTFAPTPGQAVNYS